MTAYVPEQYWSRLHQLAHDESGIGYPDLPISLNRAMFAALVTETERLLGAHRLRDDPGRVLDVGSGTGIWIDFWRHLGADEVTGSDIARAAVERLRSVHPDMRVEVMDVGADHLTVEGPFDVISAMGVLLHVVDDDRWGRALRNLASVLRHGGHLVLIEPLVVHRWWGPTADAGSSSRTREIVQWENACSAAGLEVVEVRPATVLLSNVIDTRSRRAFAAMWWYWGSLQRATRGRERAGRAAGAVLGALDAPLRRVMPHGPSAKLMLLRRAG